jgi:hypothetical protein
MKVIMLFASLMMLTVPQIGWADREALPCGMDLNCNGIISTFERNWYSEILEQERRDSSPSPRVPESRRLPPSSCQCYQRAYQDCLEQRARMTTAVRGAMNCEQWEQILAQCYE